MELVQRFDWFFYGILSLQAVLLIFCLIRAGKGPRIADRLVAVNMMGTLVMVMIALLAVLKDQGYLVDICLIYAMISFLAVVVLTRIYTGVYREAKEHEKEKEETENADSCLDPFYRRHDLAVDRCSNFPAAAVWRF